MLSDLAALINNPLNCQKKWCTRSLVIRCVPDRHKSSAIVWGPPPLSYMEHTRLCAPTAGAPSHYAEQESLVHVCMTFWLCKVVVLDL